MISGPQIREARRLLRWSRTILARKAMLSLDAICRAEENWEYPALTDAQLAVIVEVVRNAGIIVLPGLEGESAVRWCWAASGARGVLVPRGDD